MSTTKTYRDEPVASFAEVVGVDGQLIDVREPDEFAAGTLPGAVNIPLASLPSRMGELDPQRPVVLLCRSGARSTTAAKFLAQGGFDEVVNLAGGMLAMG